MYVFKFMHPGGYPLQANCYILFTKLNTKYLNTVILKIPVLKFNSKLKFEMILLLCNCVVFFSARELVLINVSFRSFEARHKYFETVNGSFGSEPDRLTKMYDYW